jgi:hypothetical protein
MEARDLPAPVRLLNAVGRATGDLGPAGRLDADELLRDATRRTGLSDLGPDTDDAFRLLVASLDCEARLTTLGRLVFRGMLATFLRQRLQVVEAHRRRPDLAPVRRPLFVVGWWRTGTTLLHNLLAQAQGARPLLIHEAHDPIPPGLTGGTRRDLRPLRYALQRRGMYYLAPELPRIHNFGTGPAECLRLLGRSFTTSLYPHMAAVPSYERWLWEQGPEAFVPTYELHAMQLQTLQADGRPGWWVLKSPAHLGSLEALLKVYPDAALVQTHRDPGKVIGSLASLVAVGHGTLAEPPDPRAVGRRVLGQTTRTLERAQRSRAVLGDDRVLDVAYADLVAHPITTVRRILQHFGYPVTGAGEDRMRGWLAANPQGKHGRHQYSLERFGLTAEEVDRATASYRERFGVPVEH